MTALTSTSIFNFKGVTLTTGDHVAFKLISTLHKDEEGAFLEVNTDGNIVILNPLLGQYSRNTASFSEKEIEEIRVLHPRHEAACLKDGRLRQGQPLQISLHKETTGVLIAVFGDTIAMWSESHGKIIAGASKYFEQKSETP